MTETLARRRSRRSKTRDLQERELRRLLLSVCDDVGFRLYLATYDQPKRRDELIGHVIEEAAAEKVKVTRLDIGEAGRETNLVGLLRAHLRSIDLPPGWRQAVMVTGIEQRLEYSSGSKGYAFLHQANLLRDALPEAAPVPVVLWLSRMASAALPAEAPDLWHWRAANFDFTGDEAPRLELLRELAVPPPTPDSNLSPAQRQSRIRMLEELLAELEREGPPKSKRQAAERASLLLDLAVVESSLGRLAEAIPHFEQTLEAFRQIDEPRGQQIALRGLGLAWRSAGEIRKAIECYDQQLEIARKMGDQQLEGNALDNLGKAWAELGEPRQAIHYHEQAVELLREVGDQPAEGSALSNLGRAWYSLGEPRRAIQHHEQAVELLREIGDRPAEANALRNLGSAWYSLGEPRRAIEYHEQALTIAREVGDRRRDVEALLALGAAYANLGEVSRALALVEEALANARDVGARDVEGFVLFTLALARDSLGERADAVRRMREALAIFEAIGPTRMDERARAQLAEWAGQEA